MLIARIERPTLVHVPTIDLMGQWNAVLSEYFDIKIGMLGGGVNDIQLITVATYDSALLHVPYRGNQFGLLGGGVNDIQLITVATYDSALLHVPYRGNQFGLLVLMNATTYLESNLSLPHWVLSRLSVLV